MPQPVTLRKDLPSATIRIDVPETRNALGPEVVCELIQAFDDLHGEQKVRAVILTGSDRAFSSGTDLKALARQLGDPDSLPDPSVMQEWRDEVTAMLDLLCQILRFPKPVIAVVNGDAAGTGLALALACDLVVGGVSSVYSVPETRLGLVPGLAAPLLGFRLGNARARQIVLAGARIDSDEALRIGLIDEQVADDLAWAKGLELAKNLAAASPASQQLAKQLCNETIGESLFTQLANGAANMAAARFTDAARKGVNAFLLRKTVDWTG
jgi:methylglutaconyl-CoA hydratase